MDIKEKITEIIQKIKSDPEFGEKFKSDPIGTVKSVLGAGTTDDMIQSVVSGVKAKLAGGDAGDILGKVKKLF